MEEFPVRQNASFYRSLFLQHGLSVSTYVSHVNYRVYHAKFKILTEERMETIRVHVL